MKRITSLLFAGFLLLASCNNKKPDNSGDNTGNKESGSVNDMIKDNMENMASTGNDMQKKIEALQKLPPLSVEELKKVLPDELFGVQKSNYSASVMVGVGQVSARYKLTDNSNIKISVFDCTGPMGVGIYSAQFMTLYNFEQEDDNGYTKSTTFDGKKAIEQFKKHNNEYQITYFTGERYLVTLEGENTTMDQLKTASKSISLK